ncbi:hypothetical protein LDENG_00291120 [Lucifuga dentata]|nr:hypothetical protein LDENG_00291120 [Lucifuga dentata]
MLTSYEPARSLRSSGSSLLTITKSNLKTKGDRAFMIRVPKVWNDLPEDLKLAKSVSAFKSQLKTHFYKLAFMRCLFVLFLVFAVLFLMPYFYFVLICLYC